MPARNRTKQYVDNGIYHVYNRGGNRQLIFRDQEDRIVFMSLLKRYLGNQTSENRDGKPFRSFQKDIDLLAFCLMPNHFHFVVRQRSAPTMADFMQRVMTSYAMYFNRRHKRTGPLFEGPYQGRLVDDDRYLQRVIAYVHLNPEHPFEYPHSSHGLFVGKHRVDWAKSDAALQLFGGRNRYLEFITSMHAERRTLTGVANDDPWHPRRPGLGD
ncbi:MAG: transposase [Thermoleophilaceae bacterium]|nr:transposase [Thermoleophilaceae bacterium]